MMGFIDVQRSEGHAVESVCRVLRQQGCQIAARTYRSWSRAGRPVAARTVSDALVVDAVRQVAWTLDEHGVRSLTPEGLYGRRKMTAYLRRTLVPAASAGSVDRAMRLLGLAGVRRDKGTRTTIPAKDGIRAGDLLNRDFTAPAPNRVWVTDFTYVRTWAGFTYVAFVVDVFAQKIVAWHAATSKATDLVMIPLRMALWARDREGHRPAPGQLICHSDAGSQGGFNWSSQHLEVEVWDGSTGGVDDDADGQAGDAVAGQAAGPSRCRARVLARDRFRADERGRGGRVRCVGAGRVAVVPGTWRDVLVAVQPVVGAVPVVRRAGGHCGLAGPAGRRAGDCSPARPVGFDCVPGVASQRGDSQRASGLSGVDRAVEGGAPGVPAEGREARDKPAAA